MKKFPNFKERDLSYFGWRQEAYFASEFISCGLSNRKNLKKHFKLNRPLQLLQVNFEFFNIEGSLKNFTQDLINKIHKSDKKYINNIVKGCMRAGKKLQATAKRVGTEGANKKLSEQDLAALLEKFSQETYNYCVYYIIAWFEKPKRELAESLAKKYARDDKEFKELFSSIATPSRETAAEYEQDDFLRLCARHKLPHTTLEKLAEQHAHIYGWLSVRYFIGAAWTGKDILKRLASANKNKAANILQNRIKHRKQTSQGLNKWLKKMTLRDRGLVQNIRDIIFLRTQRSDFFHHASFFAQPLLENIASHLNISYSDLLNFKPKEIISALQGNYNLQPHIIPRRQCLVVHHNSQSIALEGEQALSYVKKRPLLQRRVKKETSLHGIPAFEGTKIGTARIVLNNNDVEKVKKGDILITTMTTPNFIAAMESAAAFVTDEGGILCHAAIISREMKKPCIIGTKIATKVLHDGDMVEVDANKGTVKKL